jgi:hypothetical protein
VSDELRDAKLKIERANHHIRNLKAAVHSFRSARPNPYTIEIKPDPDGYHELVVVRQVSDIPDDVFLIAGDAIHNLRATLDILACCLAMKAGAASVESVEFPFAWSFKDFASSGKQGKIQMLGADAIRWIAELEPYRGGDDLLHALHILDINDKHCRLLAITPGPVDGEIVSTKDAVRTTVQVEWIPMEKGVVIERRIKGDYSQNELRISLNIAFGDYPTLKNRPIMTVADELIDKVKTIVADCEMRFF